MSSFTKSADMNNTLLSQMANTSKPRALAEYVKSTDPKLSRLFSLLPADAHVLDISQEWYVKEYNAHGPALYVYNLYVYYADKCPMYTQHTYNVYTNHPDPEQEEYCLDHKGPRKLPIHSSVYARLSQYCKQKTDGMNTYNPFSVFAENSEDSE